MADRVRAHDWSATALGPRAAWPQSLRTALNMVIGCRQPMFIAWGPRLTLLYNDAYAVILGARHPLALGRPFRQIWSDIWDDVGPLVERTLAGESIWSENLRLLMHRNGFPEETWYSFSYSPLRDDRDEVAGLFCACTETTAQVLAGQRLVAERERLFELSRDLFGVAGYDGRLRSINPAWARLLGRSTDELMARPFIEIVHPEDLETTGRVLVALKSGQTVRQFRVRLLRADGESVCFAWSAVADTAPDSDIFYTVGRDITDELRGEEVLRQSQKMEAVGRLTGGIAHGFNNLLQAVQGNLDLIRRRPDDPEKVGRWADKGLTATGRGTRLTAQLLAFSRAQQLEMRATPVEPFLVGMKVLLQQSLGPLVSLHFHIEDELSVMTDPTQLEMALLNLTTNAREAMPEGGTLSVRARECVIGPDPELEPGRYVEICLTDSGVGMSAEVANRALEPFFTTRGIGKGSGLGLSQVHGMTRQAGGTVRIESQLAVGTSIALLFRRAELPARCVMDAPARGEAPLHARSILVVDDDPDVRQVLAEALQTLGLDVATADDGPQAVALLNVSRPDLLLLDFAMPGMNGAEVARLARGKHPALPIVFATGYSETAAVEAVVGGSAVILKKPFQIADLEAALRTAVCLAEG